MYDLNKNYVTNELSALSALTSLFPNWFSSISIEGDQFVAYPSSVLAQDPNPLLYTLSHSSLYRFKALNDLYGSDLLNYASLITSSGLKSATRYEVHYFLLSVLYRLRLRIVIGLSSQSAEIASVTSLYPSANWLEREVWDMYGVNFFNHIDLRRILTDYGFAGFPLRKEFPLTGYVEVRYSEKKKRVVLKPVTLSQEYRRFEFTTPWDRFYLK